MKSLLKSKLTSELETELESAPKPLTETEASVGPAQIAPRKRAGRGHWALVALVAVGLALTGFVIIQARNAAPPAEPLPADHTSLLGISTTHPTPWADEHAAGSPQTLAVNPSVSDGQKQGAATALKTSARASAPAKLVTAPAFQPLLGSYVGDFIADKSINPNYQIESHRINLTIDGIQDGKISGHTVVAGLKRPFKGTISPAADGSFSISAREPGTHPYDGTFSFKLSSGTVTGKWQTNNQRLSGWLRNYELSQSRFKYDPGHALDTMPQPYDYTVSNDSVENFKQEGISGDAGKYNASKVRLTGTMVENMYRRDLEVMRNSIYARHGYAFGDPVLRRYFEAYSWYVPVSLDVSRELTQLEQANIALIQRYERHATRYYDHFGR
ncbi:MAG: YARHG domain-containing protein [Candidatus Sericytochromatia bacterium]